MKRLSILLLLCLQGSSWLTSDAYAGSSLKRSSSSRQLTRRASTGSLHQNQGYRFVGYHGTSEHSLNSMMRNGLDPSRIGSASGTARGPGLYAARNINLARDFADNATQQGDPNPRTGEPNRYSGTRGQMAIGRVYARDFSSMRLGRDYDWGVMSGGALRINPHSDAHDLEIVMRPSVYSQLRIERHNPEDSTRPVVWRSHEAPF